jgi:hypothetical protein
MKTPNIPDVVTIDELIKRADNRKNRIKKIATDNQSFDKKATSHRQQLFSKAKEYIKSLKYKVPGIRIPVRVPALPVTAFPRLPSLPLGFKIPQLPNPPITNDGGKYMKDMAESIAAAAATAIKQKANAIATKIAAAATFPPTGAPVAIVLTAAEKAADKLLKGIISSIKLPTTDIDAAMANPLGFLSDLSADIDAAVQEVETAGQAAEAEIAVANAAYTAQKKAMDDATAKAQSTADTAQVTATQANATAQQANATAQQANATAQSALSVAQQAVALANQALNQPVPTAPPPVTVIITPPPTVTPTVTPLPPGLTICPATQIGVETSRTPFDTEFNEVCRWQQNMTGTGGCIEICTLERIVMPPVSPTPPPPTGMAQLIVYGEPSLPHDFAAGGMRIADVTGTGLYPIDSVVTVSYSNLRSDYRFLGWFAADPNIPFYTGNPVPISVPAGGLTITGKFELITSSVPPTSTPTPTPPSGGGGGGSGGGGGGGDQIYMQ